MNDTSDLIPENETNWQNDWQIPYFDNLTEEQQKEITDSIRLLLRQTFVLERKYDKKTSTYTERRFDFNDTEGETGGHFGGDRGLVSDFCGVMLGKKPSFSYTSIENSVIGHLLVYAADESLQKDRPVDL